MQVHTLTHMESAPTPVQIGEPFRCWECGSPDQGGMFLIIDHSPLEAYTDHVYYMRLACGHNPRCLRLANVQKGDYVLEVACGTGRATVDLAELVGPEGRLAALELSEDMLRIAQRTWQVEGLGFVSPVTNHT